MSVVSVERVLELREAGELARALECAERLVVLQPATVDALHLAGVLHCELEHYATGLLFLNVVNVTDPSFIDGWLNSARAQRRLGRSTPAMWSLLRAILLDPSGFAAVQLAASAVATLVSEEPIYPFVRHTCQWAVLLQPNSSEALMPIAAALVREGQHPSALDLLGRALSLSPCLVAALSAIAAVFVELGNPAHAARIYGRAWGIQPENHDFPYWLSLLQLADGDFVRGWLNYEHRWLASIGVAQLKECGELRSSRPPYQEGGGLKRVLVWAEQGVGDEIMFGGLLSDFHQRCSKLIVQVDPRLRNLFANSFPSIEFVGTDEKVLLERYDEQLSMGSLGRFVRPTKDSFAGKAGRYLWSSEGLGHRLRQDLSIDNDDCLIGLSWRSANPNNGARRSLPLELLLSAFRSEQVRFLNLQYGASRDDLSVASQVTGCHVHCHPAVNLTNDFDGIAGLIEACNLVISVGNATAHLSGALGKPTWVLLPYAAGWRWMREGSSCPWYPSVRLFRQRSRGDWRSPVTEAQRAFGVAAFKAWP